MTGPVPTTSAPAAPAVVPRHLELLTQAAAGYEAQELSERTKDLYRRDWATFAAWCELQKLHPLPADVTTVCLFVADMARKWRCDPHPGATAATVIDTDPTASVDDLPAGRWMYKPSTIERRLAAIAWAHKKAYHPNPTADQKVRASLLGARRLRRTRVRRMRPILTGDIRRILDQMEFHTWPAGVKAHRDALLLLTGFAGGRRRSEIAALTLDDITRHHDGLHVFIRQSKTDQVGEGMTVLVPVGDNPATCGPCLHWRWLRLVEAREDRRALLRRITHTGPPADWQHVHDRRLPNLGATGWGDVLFPQVRANGIITAHALTGAGVHQVVKDRAAAAGLVNGYGAHSLRAGFVTQAKRAGADNRSIRKQTGHGSDATMELYDREYDPGHNNAAKRLGL